jgi:hypothetical protein
VHGVGGGGPGGSGVGVGGGTAGVTELDDDDTADETP